MMWKEDWDLNRNSPGNTLQLNQGTRDLQGVVFPFLARSDSWREFPKQIGAGACCWQT